MKIDKHLLASLENVGWIDKTGSQFNLGRDDEKDLKNLATHERKMSTEEYDIHKSCAKDRLLIANTIDKISEMNDERSIQSEVKERIGINVDAMNKDAIINELNEEYANVLGKYILDNRSNSDISKYVNINSVQKSSDFGSEKYNVNFRFDNNDYSVNLSNVELAQSKYFQLREYIENNDVVEANTNFFSQNMKGMELWKKY